MTPAGYGSYASESGCTPSSAAPENAETIIVLKGGLQFEVTDYWVAGDQPGYVTADGAQGNVPLNQLDLEQTVNLNWRN